MTQQELNVLIAKMTTEILCASIKGHGVDITDLTIAGQKKFCDEATELAFRVLRNAHIVDSDAQLSETMEEQ